MAVPRATADAELLDHVYDEIVVERALAGIDPGRPLQIKEAAAVVRALGPNATRNELSLTTRYSRDRLNRAIRMAFPDEADSPRVAVDESEFLDEGESDYR